MRKISSLVFLLSLTLIACGGVKSGPGVDSGTCNAGVVKDYQEAATDCQKALQGNGRRSDGFETCGKALQEFLDEYPKVSCDIAGTNKRSTGARIEYTTLQRQIEMMKMARSYPQYP
jgi:hypothetical protein